MAKGLNILNRFIPRFILKWIDKRRWKRKSKLPGFIEYFDKYGGWEKLFERSWNRECKGFEANDIQLKFHYWFPKEVMEKMYSAPNPFLKMVKKDYDFIGEPFDVKDLRKS